jgi:hypothetical protein
MMHAESKFVCGMNLEENYPTQLVSLLKTIKCKPVTGRVGL